MIRTLSNTARNLSVGAALALAAGHAAAEKGNDIAEWSCWYNEDTTVICMLAGNKQAPSIPERMKLDQMLLTEGATALRALGEIGGELPKWFKLMRDDPDAFAGRRVTIPLYSPPDDFDLVYELAMSVMCGAKGACRVVWQLRPTPTPVNPLAPTQAALTD